MDYEKKYKEALEVAFNSIPSLLSDVNEAADKYTDNHANYLEYSDDGWEDKTDIDYVERAFKAGAEWRQSNLWKSADGDDLPEIDREVIVFTQTERQYPKVAIAHTMPMGDWKQFDGNRYYLERNGEVGWSIPDVKIWLDCDLPLKEDEV